MSWKAGAITGDLRLNTQQHDTALRSSVQTTQAGAAQMKAALDKPFAPAVVEVKKLSTELSNATNGMGRFTAGLGKIQSFTGIFAAMPGSLGNIAARTSALTGTFTQLAGSMGSASAAAGSATAATTGLAASAAALGPALAAIGIAAAAIAPPLIGLGIVKAALGSEFVQLAALAETTAVAFRVMTGSAATAKALISELKTFAAATPLTMPEITAAAKQLLAMGGSAQTVTTELRMLGDIGSLVGAPLQEMAYLYGQIRSQQTAYTQDLNQLAGRGIPIYSELGKILGTNAAGVKKLASEGEVTFPLIEQAFKNMTAAGGQFNDGMKQQAETLTGLQSTMEDAWITVQETIGNAIIESMDLKELVRSMTELIEDSGPMIVSLFKGAVTAGEPFVGIFASTLNLLNSINSAMSAAGKLIDDAFGEGSAAALAKWVGYLNPALLTIRAIGAVFDGIAWVVKEIGSGIEAISWLWSDDATAQRIKNSQAIGRAEMEQAIRARDKKRADAGGAEKTESGAVVPGTPVPAAKPAKKVDLEKEAAASADRTADIQMQTRLAAMRAAGKEAEAAQLDLWNKWEAKYNKATTDAERAAVNAGYAQERADLTAKQRAEQDREATRANAEIAKAAQDERNKRQRDADKARAEDEKSAKDELARREADLKDQQRREDERASRLGSIAGNFSNLSGAERAGAYGSLARAAGSASAIVMITSGAAPLARQANAFGGSTATPQPAPPADPRLVQELTRIREEVRVMHSTTLQAIQKNTTPAVPVKVGM
jgi:tape measure domain-containing protein